MINRDWEKFGEEIRKTVQDAIDAQDFNKLNQTVTDTIERIYKVREKGTGQIRSTGRRRQTSRGSIPTGRCRQTSREKGRRRFRGCSQKGNLNCTGA